MPVKYVCDDCGKILYQKRTPLRVGSPLKTPQEVIDMFEGRCPRCRKELVFNTKNIVCKEFEGNQIAYARAYVPT
jgi:hypothetical protein